MTDLIAEALTEYYGDRCPDHAPGCPCCDAWAEYDRMTADPWQPIATAPKTEKPGPEGLIIIGNQAWTQTVFWQKAGVISEPEEGDLWVSVDAMWSCPINDCTATHWRPNDVPQIQAHGCWQSSAPKSQKWR